MTLKAEHRAELERLGIENVRQRLNYAGAGSGSIVPGVGDGRVLRSDVENWLAQEEVSRARRSMELQESTLWWAKAATGATIILGITGIVVAVIIALLQKS
jgi:hypothetical protein